MLEEECVVRVTRDRVRREAQEARRQWDSARLAATQANAAAEAARRRVADAEAQHTRLGDQVNDARHLQRLGELLHAFRNTLVATVGPRLSAWPGAAD